MELTTALQQIVKHLPGQHDQASHGRGGGGKGSADKGRATSSAAVKVEAPDSYAFLKEGNPGRGGDVKLPTGWRRTRVDEAVKRGTTGTIDYEFQVGYHNGYYATVGATYSPKGAKYGGGRRNIGGHRVEWDKLQGELDKIAAQLSERGQKPITMRGND